MRFGITLANRGILLGLATVRNLLALADANEALSMHDPTQQFRTLTEEVLPFI